MYGMGAMSSQEIQAFQERLNSFKTLLIGMYRQKTKFIAERDTLRFKYISSLKTKLENIIGAMLSQSFIDGKLEAHAILENLTAELTKHIPMAKVDGGDVNGYGRNLSISRYGSKGYLSTMNDLLINPMNSYEGAWDKRPAYKIYEELKYLDLTPGDDVAREFLNDGLFADIPFSYPPTKEWFEAFIRVYAPNNPENYFNEYGYVNGMLTKNFPQYGGSFTDTLLEMKAVLLDEALATRKIMEYQADIDKAEADLANFIAEFSEYAQSIGLTVSDILRDLQAAAEAPEEIPAAAAEPKAKSKLPWLLAAAAAGIYLVTKED